MNFVCEELSKGFVTSIKGIRIYFILGDSRAVGAGFGPADTE